MKKSALVSLFVSTIALMTFACSAPAAPDDDEGGKQKTQQTEEDATDPGSTSKPDSKPGTTTSTGPSTNPSTPGPTTGGTCGGETTSDACWTCCESKNATVAAKAKEIDKKWLSCACTTTCASACQNDAYCKNGDPDADPTTPECEACIDGNTAACDTDEEAAWEALEASTEYASVDACAEASQCDAKPEEGDDDDDDDAE